MGDCRCKDRHTVARPELDAPRVQVAAPGIHHNVNVEIDHNGNVVRLWPAQREIVRGCDSCG